MRSATLDVTVRDAVAADLGFLRDALSRLNEEMRELACATGVRREDFQGLNIDGCLQRETFLIAVQGEEPRGFLSIYFPCPPSGRPLVPPQQQATISTACVVPESRRQGIVSILLAAAEARCRAWGATGIGLGFIEGNHAAEAAYRKTGFVATRRAMWRRFD